MAVKKGKNLIIAGPTGSGKTELACKLAGKYSGELINVDSRQIYKYLDIGTNKGPISRKDNKVFINDKQIHLIDFLEPDQNYDLHQFILDTEDLIGVMKSNQITPIVVGGTGLYIDALVKGYKLDSQEVDEAQRDSLNKLSLEELKSLIDESVIETLNNSDRNNPRRLIRIIEKSKNKKSDSKLIGGNFSYEIIYIDIQIEQLENKLEKRVLKMWQEGIVEEVKNVLNMGYSRDSVALQGIGYREVLMYLDNELTEEQCIERIHLSHRQYAKRQITWFQKYLNEKSLRSTNSKLQILKPDELHLLLS